MTAPKHAAIADGTPCPPYWEKLVLVAYYAPPRRHASPGSRGGGAGRRAPCATWEADQVLWARAT